MRARVIALVVLLVGCGHSNPVLPAVKVGWTTWTIDRPREATYCVDLPNAWDSKRKEGPGVSQTEFFNDGKGGELMVGYMAEARKDFLDSFKQGPPAPRTSPKVSIENKPISEGAWHGWQIHFRLKTGSQFDEESISIQLSDGKGLKTCEYTIKKGAPALTEDDVKAICLSLRRS